MQHANHILFITRKWRGWGGMQQMNRDLWRGMQDVYGERAKIVVLGFPISLSRGERARERGSNSSIHIHLGDAALVPLGWLLKKFGARRVTVTVCGLDVIWPKTWYQWILKRTLPQMDHVVCISRATAEEVCRRGVREDRISIIPCGVWENACHAEEPRRDGSRQFCFAKSLTMTRRGVSKHDTFPILLTVGRLVRRKGHAWFTEHVLPTLIRTYPKLEYWIIGDGSERHKIERIVRKQNIEHHVRLFGSVADHVREDLYAKADVFVMPNIPVPGDMEGFGIACIEAGSRGVPVVAARLEGLNDAVIEGKTGLFFESGNSEDCAAAIQSVLGRNFPLPAGEGKGEGVRDLITQETYKHFSWPRLFQRYQHEVFRC